MKNWKKKGLPVKKFVHGNGHVSGLLRTIVNISIVFGQKIDIVKDETVESSFFEGFHVTHVHEHGSIELPGALK